MTKCTALVYLTNAVITAACSQLSATICFAVTAIHHPILLMMRYLHGSLCDAGCIHIQLTWQGPICADLQVMGTDLSGSNLAKTTCDKEGRSIDMIAHKTSTTTIQNYMIYKLMKYCQLDTLIYHYHADEVIIETSIPHNKSKLHLHHHEHRTMIFWQTEKSS